MFRSVAVGTQRVPMYTNSFDDCVSVYREYESEVLYPAECTEEIIEQVKQTSLFTDSGQELTQEMGGIEAAIREACDDKSLMLAFKEGNIVAIPRKDFIPYGAKVGVLVDVNGVTDFSNAGDNSDSKINAAVKRGIKAAVSTVLPGIDPNEVVAPGNIELEPECKDTYKCVIETETGVELDIKVELNH